MFNKQTLFFCITIIVGCNAPDNHSLSITPTIYLSATPNVLETNIPEIEVFTQTSTPEIPNPVAASEAEKENARKILQEYYSVLPYLNETTSYVYYEYHGCVETNDVGGVVNYYTVYSLDEVKRTYEKYFQSANWEYSQGNGIIDNKKWEGYSAFRTSNKETPILTGLFVYILELSEVPIEARDTVSKEVMERKTNVVARIAHIESVEKYRTIAMGDDLFSSCELGWWLWIGP